MLQRLKIKNIALIDSVEINFSSGLNVLSGETGAGKSVIIESLNFVLGAKADKSLIRSGEQECFVSAEFYVGKNPIIIDIFNELDIEADESLIITRKFNLDGKSSIKINGESATVSMIRKFTFALVDVHGQSEHFELLSSANQLKLLDKIGGDKIALSKEKVCSLYYKLKNVNAQIEQLGGDESQRAIRLDVLSYQINEISVFDLKEGEEEELLEIRKKLINQEKINNSLNTLKSGISDEGGISDILSNAIRSFSAIASISNEYSIMFERISSAYSELDDISSLAQDYIDNLDIGEIDAEYVESRLEGVKKLKKKYGVDYSQIMQFLAQAKAEKERLENIDETFSKLIKEQEILKNSLYNEYIVLSECRREVAKDFENKIVAELIGLGMKSASFDIRFETLPTLNECKFDSPNGCDKIEYMFSANVGQPLKPMSEVISGGEMSRFMLAIKAQSAKYNEISTFIFDEIDAGISGNVARVVSEKFIDLSKEVQVIAITHLPQISAMADCNLLIIKQEAENKASTTVKKLNEEEKVLEIVRLSGGEVDNQKSIEHAKEIIKLSNQYKSKG